MNTLLRSLTAVIGSPPTFPDGFYVTNLLTIPQDEEFAIVSILTKEGRLSLTDIMAMEWDTVLDFVLWITKRLEAEETRVTAQVERARQQYRRRGGRRRR